MFSLGITITEIDPAGGACRAVILPGDTITGVNKKQINSLNDFREAEKTLLIGSIARVDIVRNSFSGETATISVEVGAVSGCDLEEVRLLREEGGYPVCEHKLHTPTSALALLGDLVGRQDFGMELLDQRGVGEGVLISGPTSGSAKQAGLRDGDRILWIDGVEVDTAADFYETVGKYMPGDEISLNVEGEDLPFTLEIGVHSPFFDTPTIRSLRMIAGLKVSSQLAGDKNRVRSDKAKKVKKDSKEATKPDTPSS